VKKYSLKRAEDPENITAKKFIHQTQDKVLYLQNAWQGREAYESSGSRLKRSATARAASSTPAAAASTGSSAGPCTTGSKEMLGSRLRKHISTCSTTVWARARPSSSIRLPTTSSNWDQSPAFSPALPTSWGDRSNVPGGALRPAREVVATDERRALARCLHYEEA
jgi:hypothetical protein